VDAAEVRKLTELEDRHWWYVERRAVLRRHLRTLGPPGFAVDIGAAGGGNSRELVRAGWHAVALEYGETGAQTAMIRGIPVARGDAHRLPLADRCADLVVCLDVIEHLDDDVLALAEMGRVLKPGGRLLLAVPADPSLWSPHDDAVGHLRRYTRSSLLRAVASAGLRVESVWSWNVLLKPVVRLRRHKSTGSDLAEVNPVLNTALRAVVALERRVPLGGLPGVSLFVDAHA
jgi:SAM-dependent methyltransferase